MLGLTGVLLALLLGLVILQFCKFQWTAKRLPPGPTPLPIIGNLWTVKFQLHHETLMQLARTYGNIMTLWAGQTPLIVLNGYQAVRDALVSNSENFSDRPVTPFFKLFANEKGIIVSNGHTWKQQRRFGLKTLRDLGLGKKGLEWRIQGEAQRLVEFIYSLEGRALDPKRCLMNSVSNVVTAMSFGHHFPLDDKLFLQLIESTDSVANFFGTHWGQLYDAFPWLMHRLPGPQQQTMQHLEFLRSFVMQEIRHHQENPSGDPQDVIDFYLDQIAKTKDDPTSTFNEGNLMQVLIDFFLAGTETTTTTLQWALLYMVIYPDIQDKVQKELDACVETEVIHYEDRKRLQYTNAVIHEIQRCRTALPCALPRQCVKDSTVQGYWIKEGTIIVFNLASAHCDPNHWDAPDTFTPTNFLDMDGNFKSNEAFLPFSAGHRICMGEQLAKTELFIFFTSLLRAFTFRLPQGVTEVNMTGIFGTTFKPHPYQICAIRR
ncbi:cytochrome P450 2J2-like isoform X1 [Ascaphus truei]|uniref:cytochrome P450 2J2-like isoform X1 n=1 Tax=Ascaphus truei TaxID=8439 RepID=UPI003F59C5D6